MGERPRCGGGSQSCICNLGSLDADLTDLGSLVGPWSRCFNTDTPAPRSGGEDVVDCSVRERRNLRGTGVSRLLPTPIRRACTQSMDSVIRASGTIRDRPRVSGHRSVRENCSVRPFVWCGGTVARQLATGHGGAHLVRYCQWHLWNLAASWLSGDIRRSFPKRRRPPAISA